MNLKLEKITVTNDDEVILSDINFEFLPGKIYVLIGRTRSGKSSMMRLISGLIASDEGSIFFRGKDFNGVPIWERNISMVYQQFINYPTRTVLENVQFPLIRSGVSKVEAKARALEMIEKVGLTSFLDRKPGQLSGGQQQRVAIARALVRNANIVLLDEPLMNLDYKLREQLREEFRELFASTKEAVTLYATTEPSEALILGDELLVLHEGRIIQFGKPSDVYENPANVEVAKIINDPPMTILQVKIVGGEIIVGEKHKIKLPQHMGQRPDGDYQVGVRANEIHMNGGSDLKLAGKITLVEVSGSETLIYYDSDAGEVIIQQEGIHDLYIGENIMAAINPERLFLFESSGILSAAPGN